MIDLFVKNAKSVDSTGMTEENICIDHGKIVGKVSREMQIGAKTVIDAEGRFVIPGAVDSHCHIGQIPGTGHYRPQTAKVDNFRTETNSALYGGTTTALNYMFSEESFETTIIDYQKWVKEASAIDMKLHGGLLSQLHIDNLPIYIDRLGLTSFKIFLPYKGEEARKLGGLNSLSDGQVLEAFTILKRFNALPIVHCENPDLIEYYMTKNQRATDQSLSAWESTRPSIVESESANKVLYFATKIGNKVAIAHVSSGDTVDVIERYSSVNAVLETCPHYLALSSDMPLGSLGKVSPPIRSRKDQDRLWEAIAEYPLVMIGSDHNAWLKLHKRELWDGFAGLPNNAFILPVLFTEGFGRRGISPTRIAQVSSANPAQQVGLFPRKGSLAVGSDADIVIMDTGIKKKISPAELGSISDYSPFEDYEFTAWPHAVIARGELAVESGKTTRYQACSKPAQYNQEVMKKLVYGGTIVSSVGVSKADILIENEVIVGIGDFTDISRKCDSRRNIELIEAHDCIVIPGGIDAHTHMDYPLKGFRSNDDYWSGSCSAAAGGTTTIVVFLPLRMSENHFRRI